VADGRAAKRHRRRWSGVVAPSGGQDSLTARSETVVAEPRHHRVAAPRNAHSRIMRSEMDTEDCNGASNHAMAVPDLAARVGRLRPRSYDAPGQPQFRVPRSVLSGRGGVEASSFPAQREGKTNSP
jgi:hypothetical protein